MTLPSVGFAMNHTSQRRVVMKHGGYAGYTTNGAGGKVYLEDVSGSNWRFNNQSVWARGINPEADDTNTSVPYHIRNTNANVWILGLKTEGDQTVIRTESGGDTEVLGGQIEPTGGPTGPSTKPAFEVDNNAGTRMSLTLNFRGANNSYGSFVRNTTTGAQLLIADLDVFANGRAIHLFRFG
jgi:hypothetical protein